MNGSSDIKRNKGVNVRHMGRDGKIKSVSLNCVCVCRKAHWVASEPQSSKVLEESQCQLLNEGEDCSTAQGPRGEECKNGTGSLATAIFQQRGVENLYHKPAGMCLDEVQRFSRSSFVRQSVSV